MPGTPDKLLAQTASALAWNYAGSAVRTILSLIVGVALARLLGPGPFGLIAIAAIILGLGSLIVELGLGPALVQRPEICDRAIRYAFTLQVILGILLTFATLAAAPVVAWGFALPESASVIRALAPVFAIQSAGATAAALLRRNLRFQSLQLAEVTSYVIGFCAVGLPLALSGNGVWSLIAAQLVQASVFTIACYMLTCHDITPAFRAPDASFRRFGWQVLRTNLTNYLIGNGDNIIIGRAFPAADLGLYSRVFSLLFAPVTALVTTLQRVLFPACSRTTNIADRRRAYLASISLISLATLPAYGVAALLAPTVVRGLLGNAWQNAIPLFIPLALAMPLHALMALAGPVLWACDRVADEARAQLLTAALAAAAFITAALLALPCVAWAVVLVYAVRFLLVTRSVLAATSLTWRDIALASRGSLIALILTAPPLFILDTALAPVSPALRLALDASLGTLLVASAALAAPAFILGPALTNIAAEIIHRLPLSLRPLLARVTLAGARP